MAGGYYHTGDVASVDEDGYITYIGRTDDVFKASDYKISPFELGVGADRAPGGRRGRRRTRARPGPARGAQGVRRRSRPGHEPTRETAFAILKYAREHLAPYLRVRRLEFAELPKTISGKIRRVELRAREDELRRRGERRDRVRSGATTSSPS